MDIGDTSGRMVGSFSGRPRGDSLPNTTAPSRKSRGRYARSFQAEPCTFSVRRRDGERAQERVRHVVGLGELHGVAKMIAVAVPHHDQVDLAELAEILERVGQLGRALIQGSIMMTLPPGLAVF
ncbi:MAG TPA: hypothetical protein VD858_18065, partial [Reyranella sp.]|nr:hypothetical protein [Reyranella sp.]